MRHEVNSIYKMCLILATGLFFSACVVVFTNPLPIPLNTRSDERLLGRWTGQDEQGNRAFVEFDGRSSREINFSLFGEKSDLGYRNPIFRMVTAKIENYDYMILRPTDSSENEGYLIARYAIAGNKLTIWLLSVDKVKGAIFRGELRGEVGNGVFAGVTVTDSSQKIITFIKASKNDDLFVRVGEFERVANK